MQPAITNPPFAAAIMQFFSALGSNVFYLALLPIIYWCIDEKKGLRLYVMVLLSIWLNLVLKYLLDQPRLFAGGHDLSVGILSELESQASYGRQPSGYAQTSLVMLFIIASWFKKKWAYVCAAILCLLIGFSKIYLNIHYPIDVFAGWIIGGVLLCGYFFLSDKIEALLVKGGLRAGMIASAIFSFIMLLYLPRSEFLIPAGTMLGIGTGFCLNRRHIGFSSAVQQPGKAKFLILFARLFLGITVLALFLFFSEKVIPEMSANYNLFSFIRFGFGGFWVSLAAPWIFVKLRLAVGSVNAA